MPFPDLSWPTELPSHVFVRLPDDLKTAKEAFESLVDDGTGLELGLFTLEQSEQAGFEEAFRVNAKNAPNLNPRFEANVLYRHHLDRSKAHFYPIDDFDAKMTEAKYNEVVHIARHIKASAVKLDGNTMEEARKAREMGVNLFVPVAASGGMMPGFQGGSDVVAAGAGRTLSRTTARTRDHGYLVCWE